MIQVQSFYINYQGYDFVSFPVLYSTNVGEELCATEVIRISPENAASLVGCKAGRYPTEAGRYHADAFWRLSRRQMASK